MIFSYIHTDGFSRPKVKGYRYTQEKLNRSADFFLYFFIRERFYATLNVCDLYFEWILNSVMDFKLIKMDILYRL